MNSDNKNFILCPKCKEYVTEIVRINENDFEVRCIGCSTNFWVSEGLDPRLRRFGKNDAVNHPSHYNDGKIEVIEFIEDKHLGFHLGNAVKYIARAGKKDQTKVIEDLNKAVWYILRQIELYENKPRRPNEMNH